MEAYLDIFNTEEDYEAWLNTPNVNSFDRAPIYYKDDYLFGNLIWALLRKSNSVKEYPYIKEYQDTFYKCDVVYMVKRDASDIYLEYIANSKIIWSVYEYNKYLAYARRLNISNILKN